MSTTTNPVFDFIKLPATKKPYTYMRDGRMGENWELLLSKSREEVEELLAEWKEADEQNQVIRKQLLEEYGEKMKEVHAFFKSIGIEIFKYKKKGYFKEKNGYIAWFENNVHKPIREYYPSCTPDYRPYGHMGEQVVQGVELTNNQSPTPLLQLYDRLKFQLERKKKEEVKDIETFTKAVVYATENRLDVEGFSPKEIIEMVNAHAKKLFEEASLKDGNVIHQDCCDECYLYTVGERRCDCGNRRISAYAEGDFINGFYVEVEAY